MDRDLQSGALLAALDRAVDAVGELDLRDTDPERLLLDLTRLEEQVDTQKSTLQVLMKHLLAA